MSTILNTNGEQKALPVLEHPEKFNCVILTAEWNPDITGALRQGAVDTLLAAGVPEGNIIQKDVPGTVELVYGAAKVMATCKPSAVIVLGCVIRGDTPHFDYVCMHTANGVAMLNARGECPVIFGVLTVNEVSQALDRAGGALGNKGAEAAVAALELASF